MQIEIQTGSVVMTGIVCLFLGVCSFFDIRKKEIPLILIITALLSAAGFTLWQIGAEKVSVMEAGVSLLPGLFMLAISFGTKEKVGYGDGLLLIISGLCLGFHQCFLGLCIALLCSSAAALFLLTLHKVKKDSGIAFAPFLAFGMGVLLFV